MGRMHIIPQLNIEPSATLVMNGLVNQKRRRGERVYNLSAGEPILPTPPSIIEAATKAMRDGKTLYPPVAGIPELRKEATAWMNEWYGASFGQENCVVTAGGKFGIFAVVQALLQPGDEVVIIAPYWVSYPSIVKIFGGVQNIIPTIEAQGWKLDPNTLEQKMSSKIKILFLNNGANPTGVLYSREEIKLILEIAAKHDVIVLSDEVYGGLTYDDVEYVSCASFPEYRDRVIIIQSCSKHFAMTGWRVGFLFGPKEIVDVVTDIQAQSTSGASSVSQWAAVAAFVEASSLVPQIRNAMKARRDTFISVFKEKFSVDLSIPACGLYSFFPMSALGITRMTDDVALCTQVLEQGNVAMVPGRPFGAPGYVRCSFGAPENELKESLGALHSFIQTLSTF